MHFTVGKQYFNKLYNILLLKCKFSSSCCLFNCSVTSEVGIFQWATRTICVITSIATYLTILKEERETFFSFDVVLHVINWIKIHWLRKHIQFLNFLIIQILVNCRWYLSSTKSKGLMWWYTDASQDKTIVWQTLNNPTVSSSNVSISSSIPLTLRYNNSQRFSEMLGLYS